jgi:peptidoglycan hydrolase CwlO-like protein
VSVLDDFNRFAFERAKAKYNRAQYDQMTHDDWVALVEGYREDAENAPSQDAYDELEEKLADAETLLDQRADEIADLSKQLEAAEDAIDELKQELAERD